MNLKEWARTQGISYATARRWYAAGKLPVPARKIDGIILVGSPSERRDLLDVAELTTWLGVSVKTLAAWHKDEATAPPHYKINGVFRYDLDEVQAWLDTKHSGTSPK